MGVQVKSPPHILDLEMLRDRLVSDRDKLHGELATSKGAESQRTFGAWCVVRDVLGQVEATIEGWRDGVPQSLKAETLINDDAEIVECRECHDFIDPEADGVVEVLLDDNGPGEPPSRDGYVCADCNEKAEAEDRALEVDELKEGDRFTYQPDADPNAGTYRPEGDE